MIFFFNDTATSEIYTLSLLDALPICASGLEGSAAHDISGPLDCCLDFASVPVKDPTGFGQTYATCVAVDQDDPEILFQPAYFLADGGTTRADLPGSLNET